MKRYVSVRVEVPPEGEEVWCGTMCNTTPRGGT